MEPNPNLSALIDSWQEEHLQLLLTLAQIPAPSNAEQLRAAFCRDWLERNGATGVYIDEALNVIWPIAVTDDNPLVVFAAHSDVVFPDTDPLPLTIRDGKIYCPGIGDDTACVAALMMAAKYIAQQNLKPNNHGVLIVINAAEEGLGNLRGTKKLFADFGHRVTEFVSFDDHDCHGVSQAVGSRRYRIEVETEGGHSFSDFGNRNAIACLAALISDLYAVPLPDRGKTTYNVGTIFGGTSVNTIAQQAEMLYEFRSDCRESLSIMEGHLNQILDTYRAQGLEIHVTPVGNRPCSGDVDEIRLQQLMDRANEVSLRHYGKPIDFGSGSTDCNIPLSLGIPAICVGCYNGAGAHTREEYVLLDSLLPGLKFTTELILCHF